MYIRLADQPESEEKPMSVLARCVRGLRKVNTFYVVRCPYCWRFDRLYRASNRKKCKGCGCLWFFNNGNPFASRIKKK